MSTEAPTTEAPAKRGPGRPKGGGRSSRPVEKKVFRIYSPDENGNLIYVGEAKGVNGGLAILAGVKDDNSPLEPNVEYVSLSKRFLNPTKVEAEEKHIRYTLKSKGTGRRRSRRDAAEVTSENPFAGQAS